MKITCVAGGPASPYFSILMKRQDPSRDITVYERNPAGSTCGWGVTYWAGLLDKLHEGDPESARAVRDHSVCWSDGAARVGDRTTAHHGDEGFGTGRRRLLDLLGGHGLIGRAQVDGSAQWLNFRTLTNRTWSRGNLVLLGDAARTTHYSIGAGTTLALEDAISLAGALGEHQELSGAHGAGPLAPVAPPEAGLPLGEWQFTS